MKKANVSEIMYSWPSLIAKLIFYYGNKFHFRYQFLSLFYSDAKLPLPILFCFISRSIFLYSHWTNLIMRQFANFFAHFFFKCVCIYICIEQIDADEKIRWMFGYKCVGLNAHLVPKKNSEHFKDTHEQIVSSWIKLNTKHPLTSVNF